MIDCVIVRYLGTAVFFTHGEVQSAESKNYHRKLRQGLHQFFSLVLEYRHTRSGHTWSPGSRVNYTIQWCYVRGTLSGKSYLPAFFLTLFSERVNHYAGSAAEPTLLTGECVGASFQPCFSRPSTVLFYFSFMMCER